MRIVEFHTYSHLGSSKALVAAVPSDGSLGSRHTKASTKKNQVLTENIGQLRPDETLTMPAGVADGPHYDQYRDRHDAE